MAKTEQVRVDLEARDNASRKIDDVADKVEKLEQLDPEVDVTADTSRAASDVKGLRDDVEALSRADAEIVLRAKVDAAKGELKTLQAELRDTGERAEDAARKLDRVNDGPSGGNLRGNAIADLTGPLGDASGAASDFAGVFDGLGDIAEGVAGKLGASAAQSAAMSGVLGGLGIAVAAGAAAWTLFSQRQTKAREEARKAAEEVREITKAIKEGDRAAAAAGIVELYGDVLRAAEAAGIPAADVVRYITGLSDVLPGTAARMRDLNAAADDQAAVLAGTNNAAIDAAAEYENLKFRLDDTRTAWQTANGTIEDQDRLLANVTGALGTATTATDRTATAQDRLRQAGDRLRTQLDKIRGALDIEQAALNFTAAIGTALDVSDNAGATREQILDVKQAILDLGTTAGTNPAVIKTQIDQVDQGDLSAVLSNVNAYYARNPATMNINPRVKWGNLNLPPGQSPGNTLIPIPMALPGDGTGGGSVVNVTMNLPRGYRERDTISAARAAARRSGGLYRRTRR